MLHTNRTKGAGGIIAICALALAVIIGGYLYFKGRANPPLPPVQEEPAPTSSVVQRLAVALAAQNDSGETGSAIFTDVLGKTRVVVKMTGSEDAPRQPSHIHTGTCSDLGGIAYPLTDIQNGASETTLDIPIDELLKKLPLAINVHKSPEEANIYVSCGDLATPVATNIQVMTMMAQQAPSTDTKTKKLDAKTLAAAVVQSGTFTYSGMLADVTAGTAVENITTEGLGSGLMQAMYAKGTYRFEAVLKNLPDPSGTDFYEGWLVRTEDPFSFISTGKFNKVGETYVNKYSSGTDLSDHLFYVVTLEPDDKNPAPSGHVLEGMLAPTEMASSTDSAQTGQ